MLEERTSPEPIPKRLAHFTSLDRFEISTKFIYRDYLSSFDRSFTSIKKDHGRRSCMIVRNFKDQEPGDDLSMDGRM